MTPIIGPILVSSGGSGASDVFKSQSKYKQARPYDQPLPYEMVASRVVSRVNRPDQGAWKNAYGLDTYWDPSLMNQAYAQFRARVSDRAALATAVAEYEQSARMIRNRALQLARFVSKLRRGNLAGATRELGLAVTPKGVRRSKAYANNFLEYQFGWRPLIGDIGSAVNVLQSPLNASKVHVQSRMQKVWWHQNDVRTTPYGTTESSSTKRYFSGEAIASIGADVAVTNPNLWLANQMGFVNPLSVAWELIPYSFVVDWFSNVGQVISSFTDFYGLTLRGGYNTCLVRGSYVDSYDAVRFRWEWSSALGRSVKVTWSEHSECNTSYVSMRRSLGIPSPVLVAPYQLLNLRQAALSVALLTQRLVR